MDLRIYSNFSKDGGASLEKIFKLAQKQGVSTVSITDRNTAVAHLALKNLKSNPSNVKVVTGIELDVYDCGMHFQVLAYGFDPVTMQNWISTAYESNEVRQEKIYKIFKCLCATKGIKIGEKCNWVKQAEHAHENIYKNIRRYPENKEILGSMPVSATEFYDSCTLDKYYPLFFDTDVLYPNLDAVKRIVYLSGGKLFLSHPYAYGDNIRVEDLLSLSVEQKLNGIEVYSKDVDQTQILTLLDFCAKHNLYVTGGSGYGREKSIKKLAELKNKLFLEN
ncbi:MAG: PHP domain-containing protein [Clostridia bacterium]|nr:PHP domain-containing protein [Clostridia bacterium]